LKKIIKGTLGFLSIGAIILLSPGVKAQGQPEWRTVTTKTQLFKSDSSAFPQYSAGVNIWGNDINDSTNSYFITTDWVDASGYVELTFDILTRMPGPDGVDDYDVAVPEGYRIGAFPNPYNPSTSLVFEVPRSGNYDVDLFNVLGQKIAGWGSPKF
jgi:hypothetical protein